MTPTTIVIFGATGDLAHKKLFPALYDLYLAGCLPEVVRIVGVGRKALSHEAFQADIGSTLREKITDDARLGSFLSQLRFCTGDIREPGAYGHLGDFLATLDTEMGTCANKLYYLSVGPDLYSVIFNELANAGLSIPCIGNGAWTRIAVEKPFGTDLMAAQALEEQLRLLFTEEQIFRIDHYLGKEILENVLAFRFANTVFEPAWNRSYVDSIHLRLFESIGVGTRGAFYDATGALRDVGQNHLLQMLALVTMENPGEWNAATIRASREALLRSIEPFAEAEVCTVCMKGQYESYRSEEAVAPESKTDTYFKIPVRLSGDRWQGVPVTLESGKRMPESKAEIEIVFREPLGGFTADGRPDTRNSIVFSIQPEESIHITLLSKKPGLSMDLMCRDFAFPYNGAGATGLRNAYERLLYDALRGDQTLFLTSGEVKAAWEFITPIAKAWQEVAPVIYEDGTVPFQDQSAGGRSKH